MKSRILTGLLVFGVMFSQGLLAAESRWELKKNEDRIQASARKVEGSAILEYKGEVTVDSPLERVLALYEDEARMPEWFHQCSEARLMGVKPPDEKILYFVFDMPWPAQDRDLVFRSVRTKDSVTGVVEYRLSEAAGIYPEQDGRIRMPSLKGVWRFTPAGKDRTEIYYQSHSEVGGHIPAWLVNQLAVNIPFNSLSRLRRLLNESR